MRFLHKVFVVNNGTFEDSSSHRSRTGVPADFIPGLDLDARDAVGTGRLKLPS